MKDILEKRAAVFRETRRFFDERGFTEVETPVRIHAPAPEEFIDCPRCADGFLRASPELQMKKLLASGMDRIYQIGPCFREGERGSRHNPEFTMLEWYRRGASYTDIADDMRALLECIAPGQFNVRSLKVRQAYVEYAGWDPWTHWDRDRFDTDMANIVEPALAAAGGGIFLEDYPVEVASLARTRGDVAERWEFYLDGVELANAFSELCDASEQRRRFEKARQIRLAAGEDDYPLDEEFLEVLPRIGSAAGVALGMDRLVMALTQTQTISRVRAGI